MNKRILVEKGAYIVSGLWQDGQMIQFDIEKKNNPSLLGTIYIAKVKNIVTNIQAAFVELEEGKRAYLSLRETGSIIRINDSSDRPLKAEDEIVVQVSRDAVKTKDPVVTGHLTFTGKYAVVIHGEKGINISAKISDVDWKKQTKRDVENFLEQFAGEKSFGVIIRTNACEVPFEEVKQELEYLLEEYRQLRQKVPFRNCYSKLYELPAPYLATLRDAQGGLDQIVTDSPRIYRETADFLERHDPKKRSLLVLYEDRLVSLGTMYALQKWLDMALDQKVWLKSGGYLVIQPTEALTVIDVNSGKAVTGKQAEETFFRMNMEAAKETARQLRLRNLSGIIIVDFINMKEQKHRDALMKYLGELLLQDPVKAAVIDMTKLNLVEITRKRIRKPIYELLMPGNEGNSEGM